MNKNGINELSECLSGSIVAVDQSFSWGVVDKARPYKRAASMSFLYCFKEKRMS